MPESSQRSLAGMKILDGLDDTAVARLEARCRWRRYRSGETVFARGSKGREVFFIAEGAVKFVDFSLSGREVAFATAGVGETFGELAAIDGKPRSASAVAMEKSLLAELPHQPFLDLAQRNVELSFRILQGLAEVVRLGDQRIMELSTLAATHRVYAELLRMAQPDAAVPDLWVVRPLPPLREIASRVSTTRETVARAIGQLYPTGILRRKGRNLYLMKKDALQEIIYKLQLDGQG